MTYHYTYKIIQPSTGFYYIGVRSCKCNPVLDPYKGSMKSWKLTKEEKALCIKEIIAQYNTREEANEDEHYMITQVKLDWKDPNCMNKHTGKTFCTLGSEHSKGENNGMYGKKHSEEAIAKMRIPKSEEHKAKISAARKGQKRGSLSEETKAKISAVHKGKTFSDETRAKISAANKGRIFSEEHKAKLSAAKKNRYI